MKKISYYIFLSILFASSNNCSFSHSSQQQQLKEEVEETVIVEKINPFLLDSAFCTNLLINSNLIKGALFLPDEDPIINIKENYFSVDTTNMASHLYGKFTDARSFHSKKNRLYRFDVIFRDTSVTNVDFELYEITKDCFGKDAEFPTQDFRKHGSLYTLPKVVGQRIYKGFAGRVYADIIEDGEFSRTYRTNKKFDLTELRDFSYYYDKDFPSKYYVTAGSKKPYAKVEHWVSPNRLVLYNYSTNNYVVLDYESLDIVDRGLID